MTKLAVELEAEDRLRVFVAHPTLEPELLRAGSANDAVIRDAYMRQRPRAGKEDWERIDALANSSERITAFQREFAQHKLRKGGSLGENYAEAQKLLTKKFGSAPKVIEQDFETQEKRV